MNRNLKFILGALGALLLVYALWYFRAIVAYILIATVLSFIGAPIVRLLRHFEIRDRRAPSWLASLLTISFFVFVVFLLVKLFVPMIIDQAQALSSIDYNLVGKEISEQFAGVMQLLEPYNLSGDGRSNEAFIMAQLQEMVSFGDLKMVFNDFLGLLSNAVIGIFSVLFMTFFFLRDSHLASRSLLAATPDRHMERMKSILGRTQRLLTRYFAGLLLQVSSVTLLITVGLMIFGVENAFFIGFLAGLLNLIPYIGPIIGAAMGIFIATTTSPEFIAQGDILPLILKTASVFMVVQLLDNVVTQPLIFSNSVNAHPLEIFIVISLAGTMAGVTGMILAIPAYTLFRIVAKEFLSGFKVIQSLTKNLDKDTEEA